MVAVPAPTFTVVPLSASTQTMLVRSQPAGSVSVRVYVPALKKPLLGPGPKTGVVLVMPKLTFTLSGPPVRLKLKLVFVGSGFGSVILSTRILPGNARFVFSVSQRHFALVLGTVCATLEQTGLFWLLSQLTHDPTSTKPLPSLSTHLIVRTWRSPVVNDGYFRKS